MRNYLIALLSASLLAALIGVLSPSGEKGALEKHMRLISVLFLICVLIAPAKSALKGLEGLISGDIVPSLPDYGDRPSYEDQMEEALGEASTAYFTEMLTQMLEEQFEIASGEVRCIVAWSEEDGTLKPTQVTVVLSGKAIWKNPQDMESFVEGLLHCPCTSAIE